MPGINRAEVVDVVKKVPVKYRVAGGIGAGLAAGGMLYHEAGSHVAKHHPEQERRIQRLKATGSGLQGLGSAGMAAYFYKKHPKGAKGRVMGHLASGMAAAHGLLAAGQYGKMRKSKDLKKTKSAFIDLYGDW